MQFINKLYTKLVFSDAPELNVTPYDMGEGMTSASLDDPVVNRLKSATGTIASMNIVVGVTLSVSILKTSSALQEYATRLLSNGYIGGTLTAYDDINNSYTFTDLSLNLTEIPAMNGSEPAVTFQIQGNLQVNRAALGL